MEEKKHVREKRHPQEEAHPIGISLKVMKEDGVCPVIKGGVMMRSGRNAHEEILRGFKYFLIFLFHKIVIIQ